MKKVITLSFLTGALYALVILSYACGKSDDKDDTKDEGPQFITEADETFLVLSGYVSAAFELDVDGKTYADSEAFYTKQIPILEKERDKAGYKGYALDLDAEVGFKDLKHNMTVYVVSDESGYGDESKVDSSGHFDMEFPEKALGEKFNIRANKRIAVTLTLAGATTIHWCYNFSGKAQSLALATDSKPVLVNSFVTSITKYACEDQDDSTLSIPSQE